MGLELIELVPIFMVFILYFLGMPIVYALFGSTFFYFTFIDTTSKNWLILQKVMTSTQSFSMLAIPFFVMAGSVMNYGGISDKMMDFAEVLTGHMKGGLAQVNVVLSMLMGGCSGSAERRLCDAVQDAGSGDGEERLLQGVLRSDHSGFLGCYTGYSAGSKPDRFYPDCTDFPGSYVCGWLYSGYPDGNLDDDRCFDYCA